MERIMDVEITEPDYQEETLRPSIMEEYIGQDDLKTNLKIFIEAAKN
ncbi:MAG: Holliday junction branch migration DNA helicase RuvB, partial [Erysipelothrix sp.]|nr:Holliday junction branch migration DNA helicase RuvB [Erysipelothrix sp.]